MIGVPLLAASITFFISKGSTKLYESSGQLATGFTTNEEINLSEERANNIRDAATRFSNLIEKINSPQVLSLVSYKLMIRDLKADKPYRVPRDSEGKPIALSERQRKEALAVFEDKYGKFELVSSFDNNGKDMLRLLRSCGYNIELLKKKSYH